MARPREFEVDDALYDAMIVFWDKGYDGASLPDLIEGMGIARGSLYKAFGDKKKLFLQTLALYDRDQLQPALELLRTEPKPGATPPIKQLFNGILKSARRGDRRGCLLCNTAAGPAAEDEEIGAVVSGMLHRLTRAFGHALRAESALRPSHVSQIARNAQALTTAYVGLRVLVRSGASMTSLEMAVAGLID
ncbi:MAG: TetR/AcrR family transcriptional regulator [Filomicrobium sp.]